jgi:predicted amidophosphoribosyltransferase
VVPITYSVDGEAMHHALRSYKDGVDQVRRYAAPRLAAILWRFLDRHESCVARAAGAEEGFEIVTTVPSSTPERDSHSRLRWVAEACGPVADRLQRVIEPTGDVPTGREYDERRYRALAEIHGSDVLLIDDTWTAGGHAQSAAHTLSEAGARRMGLIVIGRHIHRDRDIPNSDATNAEMLSQLPKRFDWSTCAVHPS